MKKYLLILLLLSITTHSLLFAEYVSNNVTLTGKVVTSDGKPAEFIQVFLQGTRYGTQSNAVGEFSFSAPTGDYTLIIQSIICHRVEREISLDGSEFVNLGTITIIENSRQLGEVVVTGQFVPQSLQNSVYRVRTINSERIMQSGATQLKGLLESELGIRFSNDLATGESDIQLMGMSGQNVKVLLDGVPLIDRGSNRQSLSQIDLNTIERVEIVEGPMSVQYGTDALAGVINLISKKGSKTGRPLSVNARIIEESVGNEYSFGDGKGSHNQHAGIVYNHKSGWFAETNATRNNFGGWQGANTGRAKEWKAREQLMAQVGTGYRGKKSEYWYRLNWLDETIIGLGDVNPNTFSATDKDFLTTRLTHQLQGSYKANSNLTINAMGSYQDYERKTQTTTLNTITGDRRLSMAQGDQDVSAFENIFGRITATNRFTEKISFQGGYEYRYDKGNGDRIQGTPSITDQSLFVAAEWSPLKQIQIRPGARFSSNSVYDAPPVIPSVNTKISLGNRSDLRLSYAKGFRAPALRELYFWFFNASHSIKGNTDLKAEHSNSYTGSFTFRPVHNQNMRINVTLSGFYNQFKDMISTARDANEPDITTYVNIDTHKTTGGTLEASISLANLQAGAGFSQVGRYNRYSETSNTPDFDWSPEVNANLLYRFEGIKGTLGLNYKYTGRRPFHEITTVNGQNTINKAYIDEYHYTDITATKSITRHLNMQFGIKNLFDVTSVRNTTLLSGGHNTSGPMPLSYGRSWFAGLHYSF
ncbi:TonB-dependent receptor [Alkaliflexus imshenetskii]|uniref:TonB-dependent receptor n=1 Tax=Alkaliflexus imshenetskii TaxID=286730 RepID=UPI000478F669|nr:TonB-dependent receptor [Alkaliflexus imshenetskii]